MRNQDAFRRAQALVLTAVRHNGPLKSHVLTDLCLREGLIFPNQIGALFSQLRRLKLIEPYANYKRQNGQLDGVVWAATGFYPQLTQRADSWTVFNCSSEYA
jgi:hypothetical protein